MLIWYTELLLNLNTFLVCTDIRILVTPTIQEKCPRLLLLSKPSTPLCIKWSYWSKFKFIKPHWPNLSFGKSDLIGCLIQVSRPQTYVKWTFWRSLTGTPTERIMSSEVTKVSDFTKKSSCKTPTNLTVDGCAVQTQASECLNSPHTSCWFP